MISYVIINYKITEVRLDGKMVGKIKVVPGGFKYFPKGSSHGGDVFPSLNSLKRDIEGE